MAISVKTNNHWRDFVYRSAVPADILADRFEWTNEDDHSDGFFNYKGWWYHLDEFSVIRGLTEDPFAGWDAYHGDSFFSGVVIRINKDGDAYQIGTYMS